MQTCDGKPFEDEKLFSVFFCVCVRVLFVSQSSAPGRITKLQARERQPFASRSP